MKKNRIISSVLIALTLCAFTSCGKKNAWLTEYGKAKNTAVKENKNLMVFFSGTDWDSKSEGLKKEITDNPAFIKAVSKDYVLVNIDFSQELYSKVLSYDEETATKKEKEEYDKLAMDYAAKSEIAGQYGLTTYPTIYLATADGFIIKILEYYDTLDSVQSMIERVQNLKPAADKMNELAAALKTAEGLDRVKAIDALFEATPSNQRSTLNYLIKEVPELDPNNSTGLLGKFEMQLAYAKAIECAAAQDIEGASKVFEDAAENGHLSLEGKQEAYYTGAYVLTSAQVFDFPRIISLLEKAYNAYPQGEHGEEIKSTIESVKQLQLQSEQDAAASQE